MNVYAVPGPMSASDNGSNGTDDSKRSDVSECDRYFSSKQQFRELCESLGVPTTGHYTGLFECKKKDSGKLQKENEALATLLKDADFTVPVILQRDGSPDVFVVGDLSDNEFVSGIPQGFVYTISPFYTHCIPVSVTALISKYDILLTKPCVELQMHHVGKKSGEKSKTIIEDGCRKNGEEEKEGRNFKLIKCGFDFDAFSDYCESDDLNKELARDLQKYAKNICKSLQNTGFFGPIGLDAIICDSTVRFSGIDRGPSTSFVEFVTYLRDTLKIKIPQSIRDAAEGKTIPIDTVFEMSSKELDNLRVGLSIFDYSNIPNKDYYEKLRDLHSPEDDAYTFKDDRITCNNNLVSITGGEVVFNPNLIPIEPESLKDGLLLVFELINRGAHMEQDDKQSVILNITTKVSDDPEIFKQIPVGIRDDTLISKISPFKVDVTNNGCTLSLFGEKLDVGMTRGTTIVLDRVTASGVPYGDIARIENGTLCVRHYHTCEYVRRKVGCKYCKYTSKDFKLCSFGIEDIREVVCAYNKLGGYDRIVIGGGCMVEPHDAVVDRIKEVVDAILKPRNGEPPRCDDIRLVCPPPTMQTDMNIYKDAGIKGITISVEVFDPPKSAEHLPGKDRVPLSAFYYTMKHATTCWNGDVRSNLIPGLESVETTREGFAHISIMGGIPVISPFHPVPGTDLSDVMPFPAKVLRKLYDDVKKDYDAIAGSMPSHEIANEPEVKGI